jgi:hypothetical protein
MSAALPHVSPIVPSVEERAALVVVACYLARAGDATGTVMLRFDSACELALAATIRDQFTAGAALCRGVLESTTDGPDGIAR